LVLHPPFWVLVIEAKRAEYSLEVGIPQALAYMLANAGNDKPTYGFVINVREFQFIKLTKQGTPRYALSYTLSLNRGDDLHTVVKVLKCIAHLIRNS
jgi:hypothetical protein